jgi:GNAT superfamily N-acetyltransferase
MMSENIRRWNEQDHELWLSLVQAYDPGLSETELDQSWSDLNSKANHDCWIIEVDGVAAGFALTAVHSFLLALHNRSYLAALYVCPDYRRRGLAGRLVQFLIEDAKRKELDGMYWVTEPGNPAYKLYNKLASPEFVRYHISF